jgi:hypothetical protein
MSNCGDCKHCEKPEGLAYHVCTNKKLETIVDAEVVSEVGKLNQTIVVMFCSSARMLKDGCGVKMRWFESNAVKH